MATPIYTMEQYEALVAAIAEGVLTVKYETKEVTYRSLDDMFKIKSDMEVELGLKTRGRRTYAEFSKGLKGGC